MRPLRVAAVSIEGMRWCLPKNEDENGVMRTTDDGDDDHDG